jgi:hypothetical protein
MHLTKDFIASEFLAATEAAGLKKVMVLVGKIGHDEYVVTVSIVNPTAASLEARFLVSSCPYEFEDKKHVREIANEKAAMFARALPTIH